MGCVLFLISAPLTVYGVQNVYISQSFLVHSVENIPREISFLKLLDFLVRLQIKANALGIRSLSVQMSVG